MEKLTTRDRIIKRLSWYYKVEGINAIWIFALGVYLCLKFGIHAILLGYGIAFVVFILIQGTHYWRLKFFALQGKPIQQEQELDRFKKFKTINEILIGLIPVFVLLQWYISGKGFAEDNHLVWAILANVFAVLEHINYYYYQLTYDNSYDVKYLLHNRKLKPASLKKDIRDGRI